MAHNLRLNCSSYPLWVSPQLEAAARADPPFSLPPVHRPASVSLPQALRQGDQTSKNHQLQLLKPDGHLPLQSQDHGKTAEMNKSLLYMEDKMQIYSMLRVHKNEQIITAVLVVKSQTLLIVIAAGDLGKRDIIGAVF